MMYFSSSGWLCGRHICVVILLIVTIWILALISHMNPNYVQEYLSTRVRLNQTLEHQHNSINVVDSGNLLKTDDHHDNHDEDGLFNSSKPTEADGNIILSHKRSSNLEKVEADLAEARVAILAAAGSGGTLIDDPDYVPNATVYFNPKVFQRSYLEMEKRLKIYVYEEGEPPVYHFGPCKHTYAVEGIFMSNIEVSRYRTYDCRLAHLFFLPISITMVAETIYVHGSHDWTPMKTAALDYVNVIARKYPFWNRTHGADHFMLACHDWGPEISFGVPNLHNSSIRALCNANTSERFDPTRDVSVPEIHIPGDSLKGLVGGPPPSKRPILVFYAGGLHGPIRPILLEHWENKSDPDVRIYRYLPQNVSYYGMMRRSKYCLCPSGYEVASPRTVEGLYLGCVPVLIKDGYVPPFSDVLNWETFAVTVAVKDIPNLKKILSAISARRYVRMQRAGIQVRHHFMVNSPPQRYDVFHMILHSIWLRRLNVRLHENGSEPS